MKQLILPLIEVGDTVKIRSYNWYKSFCDSDGDIEIDNIITPEFKKITDLYEYVLFEDPNVFTQPMSSFCGKTLRVIEGSSDNLTDLTLADDSGKSLDFCFDFWMFEDMFKIKDVDIYQQAFILTQNNLNEFNELLKLGAKVISYSPGNSRDVLGIYILEVKNELIHMFETGFTNSNDGNEI